MDKQKLAEIDQKWQSYYLVTHYPGNSIVVDREISNIEDFDLEELKTYHLYAKDGSYKTINLDNPKGRVLYDSRTIQSENIKGDKQAQVVKKANYLQDIEDNFQRLNVIIEGFEHSSIDRETLEDLKDCISSLRKHINFLTSEL